MDKTTLYLTPELRRRLRDASRRTGRKQADVIRAAIDAYLADEAPLRPMSVGAGDDETLDAAHSEDWLRERWRER